MPDETAKQDASSSFSSPNPKKLKAAQIRLLQAQSGVGSIGALLGAVTLGGALWTVVSHERIVVWLVVYAGLFLGRYYLIRSFQNRKHDDDAVIAWGKWHSLCVNTGGLLWGVAGVWLFPQDSILHQFLLSIFIAGITAAGALIYSPTQDYAATILLALLPLSGRFIVEFDEFHVIVGGVILLFAGALLLTGRKLHRVYADSLRLRSDKEELVADLQDEIVRRDLLEAELKRTRDELEVRVDERTAELKSVNRTLEQEIVERKGAEEALRESEARYRQLTENSLTGIFVHQDGVGVYVNQRLASMLDYTVEEMIGTPFLEAVHPDDRGLVAENARARLRGEPSPPVYGVRLLTKKGEVIWAEVLATLIEYQGRPAIMGNIADITQRKRAEERLKLEREQLLSIFDSINEVITVIDAENYEILYVNKFVRDRYGEDIIGGLCHKEIHGLDTPCGTCTKDIAIGLCGEPYRWDYHNPTTNKHYLATDRIIRWTDGRDAKFHLGIDVTERRKAEEALRTSEAQLSNALIMAHLGHWEYDVTEDIFTFNDHFYKIFRTTAELMGGYTMSSAEYARRFVHPDDLEVVSDEIRKAIETTDPNYSRQLEHRIIYADGDTGHISVRFFVVKDDLGRTVKTYGVNQDISDREKAEQEQRQLRDQLFQAQKMEAIGTLTGGIAHDFNNLFTIINGYAELILSGKTEDDPSYADLSKILNTGFKGADLVQRLLALSKKGESSPQPLDLNDTVENSSKLMERTFPKMIQTEMILQEDLDMVNADATQVQQVLMNLCINAREAMPDGGRLRIETRNTFVDEEYCSSHPGARSGRHVFIQVSDTGIGMNKETMDRVFDPFFTTKGWDFRKGTGLGLSVVKGIVEQHGGWVTCQSEPGKGTTFRMYFPAIEDAPTVDKPGAPAEKVPGKGKILLVDDEEDVRGLGKRILERSGYTAIAAANGKEALKTYAREQSSIALVILDLIMPQMGGEKCLEELLKIDPNVKVIVSTGHSLDARERLRLVSSARGFVNKPYGVTQLVQAVKEVMEEE